MAVRHTAGAARRRRLTLDLCEALGSALDIKLVLERAYPLLSQLIPADYGALGISSSGRAEDYEWLVARIPPAFFAAYPEMAAHDFVRSSVLRRPNLVLRDQEMIDRRTLRDNVMYRRAREVGAPLEHVMAVMLHVDERWQSGLSLYREGKRPFSEEERATLQEVTPFIVNAVRSCHLFGSAMSRVNTLETLLPDWDQSRLVVVASARIIERTETADRLLQRWFPGAGRLDDRLPAALAAQLPGAASEGSGAPAPRRWSSARQGDHTLEVSFLPQPDRRGVMKWLLLLREVTHIVQTPPAWLNLLTPAELRVTAAVLRGWDNKLIAGELGCAPATVKKHLQNIFDRLGVPSRTALVAAAASSRR